MKFPNAINTISLAGFATFFLAGMSAHAAKPIADLRVQIQAPSQPLVYKAELYTVVVSNLGTKDAGSSSLVIQLPVTATSPTVHIMGSLSTPVSGCTLSGTRLQCALAPIAKGGSVTRSFTLMLPQANKALTITASITTSSPQSSTANDSIDSTPSLGHGSYAIMAASAVSNSHCTGTGLTSYFECMLFPSSISEHDAEFSADGQVTIPGYAEYSGEWQQSADKKQLSFNYKENGIVVLNFEGWYVRVVKAGEPDKDCFDGMTTFDPDNGYVSPYRVCVNPL